MDSNFRFSEDQKKVLFNALAPLSLAALVEPGREPESPASVIENLSPFLLGHWEVFAATRPPAVEAGVAIDSDFITDLISKNSLPPDEFEVVKAFLLPVVEGGVATNTVEYWQSIYKFVESGGSPLAQSSPSFYGVYPNPEPVTKGMEAVHQLLYARANTNAKAKEETPGANNGES